jgi:hypothetical protein
MNGLRLLLFGLPGSGKSALLGALVQAGSSQAAVLHGKLADDTGRLTALREHTYADALAATSGEVIPYPIHFEPQGSKPLAVTLLDCDGRLAAAYLAGKRPLDPRDSGLARAMLEADTVILTLDANTVGAELEAELAMLRHFLTLLQEVRGRRTDVADLPVYLVLTKCDRLAGAGDTFSTWLQRIEEAKRRLGTRFAEFLTNRPASAAFGTIDLYLWATAVRRPPLSDRPAPTPEPYGVAELFRQCLASAEAFDHREVRAGRRLEFAVGGLGFLVVLMGLIAALFVLTQPDTELLRLEEEVQSVLPEPDAGAQRRLRGDLPARLKQLEDIEHNAAFQRLPGKTRAAVEESAAEFASYTKTRQRLQTEVKPPFQAKNEAEFDRYEQQARDFRLPEAYAEAWTDTSLVVRLEAVRREYASVRAALKDELDWIAKQIMVGKRLNEEGNRLPPELASLDPATRKEGRQKAEAWFAAYLKYSNRPYSRFPGDEPIRGTVSFTYGDLRKFHAVREARQEWDRARGKLDETYQYVSKLMAK